MTYSEFSKHLKRAGITAKDFADLLNKNPKSITNNAKSGKVPNELGVIAALLSEMAYRNLEFRPIISALDLPPRKIRGGAEVGKFGGNPQKTIFGKEYS